MSISHADKSPGQRTIISRHDFTLLVRIGTRARKLLNTLSCLLCGHKFSVAWCAQVCQRKCRLGPPRQSTHEIEVTLKYMHGTIATKRFDGAREHAARRYLKWRVWRRHV